METVINQHGLDIEALRSSRLPLTSGAQMGDSSTAQYAGKCFLVYCREMTICLFY